MVGSSRTLAPKAIGKLPNRGHGFLLRCRSQGPHEMALDDLRGHEQGVRAHLGSQLGEEALLVPIRAGLARAWLLDVDRREQMARRWAHGWIVARLAGAAIREGSVRCCGFLLSLRWLECYCDFDSSRVVERHVRRAKAELSSQERRQIAPDDLCRGPPERLRVEGELLRGRL